MSPTCKLNHMTSSIISLAAKVYSYLLTCEVTKSVGESVHELLSFMIYSYLFSLESFLVEVFEEAHLYDVCSRRKCQHDLIDSIIP